LTKGNFQHYREGGGGGGGGKRGGGETSRELFLFSEKARGVGVGKRTKTLKREKSSDRKLTG